MKPYISERTLKVLRKRTRELIDENRALQNKVAWLQDCLKFYEQHSYGLEQELLGLQLIEAHTNFANSSERLDSICSEAADAIERLWLSTGDDW